MSAWIRLQALLPMNPLYSLDPYRYDLDLMHSGRIWLSLSYHMLCGGLHCKENLPLLH